MRSYFSRMDSTEEIEILKSRSLAERVITKLNLLYQAEFNPSLAGARGELFRLSELP